MRDIALSNIVDVHIGNLRKIIESNILFENLLFALLLISKFSRISSHISKVPAANRPKAYIGNGKHQY